MEQQKEFKVPDEIRETWEEITLCSALIRQGKGRIVNRSRKDGRVCRYTEIG